MMGYNHPQLSLISQGAALFCEGKDPSVGWSGYAPKKNGSIKLPVGIKNSWKYEKDLYKYLKE